MIITVVADILGKENNGTTITLMRLIDNLKARGHIVRVVAPEGGRDVDYAMPRKNFFLFNRYVEKNGVALAKPDFDKLEKALDGADIVHIAMPFIVGITAADMALRAGIPITTAFHCQPENITSHFGLKNASFANTLVYKRFYKHLYSKSAHMHCPSEFIANELRRHFYDNIKLHVISNGVDPIFALAPCEKPAEFKDKFCILFSGRFSWEKRHDLLIKAAYLSKYSDQIQLIFAGCGPLEGKLKKLSAGLKNPPKMCFFEKSELVRTINYCDLYCHPSDIEIEAISCIEALSCGLVPVISDSERSATKAFALSENNLFRCGDAKSLASKIDFMIENPEFRKKQRQEYIAYAERFKIQNCIVQMEKMFMEAIADHKAKQSQLAQQAG